MDTTTQAILAFSISGAVATAIGLVVLYVVWRQRQASRRALVQRVQELTALSDAVRAIASAQLDEDALSQLVFESASKLVDTGSFHLGVFDGDAYHTRVRAFRGERQPNLTINVNEGPSIVAWMRETGRSLLIRDFDKEAHMLPATPRTVSQFPPKSMVYVPMVASDQVIGAMSIASDRVGAYTESHLGVLSIVANQAATAILNARALARERLRVQQLELVDRVASQTSAILDIDTLLPRVVHVIRETFGLYAVGLYLLDEDGATITCRASTMAQEVGVQLPRGVGLIAACMREERVLLVEDTQTDERFLFAPNMPDTRSEAVVPLRIGQDVVGALDLQSNTPNAFPADGTGYLEVLGRQVAVAVEDARLYEAEREQAWIATALLQVAEISQSAESLDDAVDAIASLAPILTGVDACAVLTYDRVFDEFGISALRGKLSEYENLAVGDVLLIEDVPALQKMIETGAPATDEGTGRLSVPVLALPLNARGDLLGALLVAQRAKLPFSRRRLDLLTGLANQAALVIDAVRANVAQQEEAWVAQALLQVAQALSQTTDVDAVAESVARLVPLLVGVQSCAIFVRDGHDPALRPSSATGLSREAQQHFDLGEFSMSAWREWVLLHEESSERAAMVEAPREITAQLGMRHGLALRLIANGRIVGALVIGVNRADALPRGRSRDILLGISQQTALAVDSARLHRESIATQRLEQELEVARSIQTSFLPKEMPTVSGWTLSAAWQAARQVGGDFYDFIRLPDERWGLVIADVADKGVPAALFMALSRTIMRASAVGASFPRGRPVELALQRANELIMNDARSDLFVTMFYAIWEPATGGVSYASGGHNPPLLLQSGALLECHARGMALGAIEGVEFESRLLQMGPGDALLLYTDGIVDALNSHGEEYGMPRLREAFTQARHLHAHDIVARIMDEVKAHAGNEPPFDDQTVLVLKRNIA